MATTIQTRRGTAAQAATANPVLAVGEAGRETDTGRLKFGDGTTAWKSLPYAPGTRFDQAEALAAKLDGKVGTCAIYVASDSTGVVGTRWPRRLLQALAADNPAAAVRLRLWSDPNQTLNPVDTVQAGSGPVSTAVRAGDNWSRTGDVKGSTSSGPSAGVWGGDTQAAGDWTCTNGTITRSSDASTGKLLLDSGAAGDRVVAFGAGTYFTSAPAATTQFRVYTKHLDNSNLIYGYLNVATNGGVTWGIARVIAGATTTVAGTANPITANSSTAQAIAPTLTVSGLTVTFALGNSASSTITMTLPQADADALAAATVDGLSGGMPGSTLGPLTVTTTSVGAAPLTISMYNGAVGGSTLDYQATRLTQQCPVTPDLVMVSSCLNYALDTPAQYLAKLDAFLALIAATWPTAGVVIMSQNQKKDPISTALQDAQVARLLAIRGWAAKRGVGYLPVFEAFRALPDLGASLIHSDGIHPTDTVDTPDAANGAAASNGSQLWGRVVAAWLKGKRLATAPTS